eukprot:9435470-Lingulodinium_polyedra.AAC.1
MVKTAKHAGAVLLAYGGQLKLRPHSSSARCRGAGRRSRPGTGAQTRSQHIQRGARRANTA